MSQTLKKPSRSSKGSKDPTKPSDIFGILGENADESYDIEKLRKVDFDKVEKLDPSQEDGFKLVAEKVVPMTMELDPTQRPQFGNLKTSELITVRILTQGGAPMEITPLALRFELTSEEDIQFYYQATLKEDEFNTQFLELNKRTLSGEFRFSNFKEVFTQLLENVEQQPSTYSLLFTFDDDNGNASLTFLLDSEIKRCELLCLDNFRQLDDEKVNKLVSYRINSLKQKTLLASNRMQELVKILRENNKHLAD